MAFLRFAREAGLALIIALATLLLLNFSNSGAVRNLETASLDLRFRLRGVEPPGKEIAVVLVDDKSLAALGRWPLSRDLFAKAVKLLGQDNAKEIVFDMLFAEPDQPIPPRLRAAAKKVANALPPGQDMALRDALAELMDADPDGDFAAAIRASGRVLLPVAFDFEGATVNEPPIIAQQSYQQFDDSKTQPVFPLQPEAPLLPLAPLAAAAMGLGHVTIAYDYDGAPRYEYVALPYGGDFMPSLSVRAAAAYVGVPWAKVGLALGDGVRIGKLRVPTDAAMRLVVNYRGPRGTFPTYSFVDLVTGKVPKAALAGRIVLIGASFIGLADTNPAPFGNTPLPGTERMANVIDSILHQDFIADSPPPWPSITIGLVVLLAVTTALVIRVLPSQVSALAGAAPIAIWCIGAQVAFDRGLWLPLVNPVIALTAATLSLLLFRYGFVESQRRRIQSAFRHYLAPDLVSVLAEHPERLQLGGETRNLTLMFSDIRGFTSIAESFKANPQGLSRLINRGFLSPMTELIMARRGTIDKYMGDCVMAFWNAPLDDSAHADHACDSALAMIGSLERINRDLEQEATRDGRAFVPLHIGVGLNTGECVVGNMGSDARFAYTAMGDAVNLASRLEGQTKTYHVSIVLGEETRHAAPGWAALELDLIAVIGKKEPVQIYTLLGDVTLAQSADFLAHQSQHDRMLACYRTQDWAGAREALAACRCGNLALAGFYDLYAERIEHFAANPPGPDWAGVFVAESK
ncbi:MAG TPA: adenylate/guanylate cyclase domain-containing protein [Stellaceae bacterium]|nr:adenylate/guanylate cyclase domain-containing protein [Stellaceae bacterium]